MINVSLDHGGLHRALNAISDRLDARLSEGLDATLESIAARAKQTTKFVDRTGALRNSIQSDGVTGEFGSSSGLIGTVSFAATAQPSGRRGRRSRAGYQYGLALEFGTRTGIRERRFIRDAIDAEDGQFIEDAIGNAMRDAGFEVGGG
jgi:hypothetical protein